MRTVIAILLLLLSVPVLAAQAQAPEQAPAPPPPPMPKQVPPPAKGAESQQQSLEPQVTIRREPGKEIEEYRIHGQLYMVKVTPKHGVPYYLVDTNGDGHLDTRMNELRPNILVPQWVLFRW